MACDVTFNFLDVPARLIFHFFQSVALPARAKRLQWKLALREEFG